MLVSTIVSSGPAADRLVRALETAVGPQGEVEQELLQLAVCLLCGGAMPLCEKLLDWIREKVAQHTGTAAAEAHLQPFYVSDLPPCLERMTMWVEGTGHEIPGPVIPPPPQPSSAIGSPRSSYTSSK